MTAFPKPVKTKKPRRGLKRSPIKPASSPMRRGKPMNKQGRVGRENLALSQELHAIAKTEGYFGICEIGPILLRRGLTKVSCGGDWTVAHSWKKRRRGKRDPNSEVLARRCAGACTFHHYLFLDTLKPELTNEIVEEAIAARLLPR